MLDADFFNGSSTSVEAAPDTRLTLERVVASLIDIVADKQQVVLDLRRSFTVEQFTLDEA